MMVSQTMAVPLKQEWAVQRQEEEANRPVGEEADDAGLRRGNRGPAMEEELERLHKQPADPVG